MASGASAEEPVWCAVANVVDERPYGPGATETRAGTRHFSAGTKVYVRNVFWGMGGEDVEVIGRHRGTQRLVTMIIRSAWLVNWRVKLVYQPRVISLLRAAPGELGTSSHDDGYRPWDGGDESRKRAERIAGELGGKAPGPAPAAGS